MANLEFAKNICRAACQKISRKQGAIFFRKMPLESWVRGVSNFLFMYWRYWFQKEGYLKIHIKVVLYLSDLKMCHNN